MNSPVNVKKLLKNYNGQTSRKDVNCNEEFIARGECCDALCDVNNCCQRWCLICPCCNP